MSLPNYDPETGVHYGVISQHSVHPEALWPGNDWEDSGYTYMVDETSSISAQLAKAIEWYKAWAEEAGVSEDDLPTFPEEDELNEAIVENVELGDSEGPWIYEQDGYVLQSTEFYIMVIKSPYIKYCRPCSPCFPNAGDLDSPDIEHGIKTYCLGPDWFENDKPHHDGVLEEGK